MPAAGLTCHLFSDLIPAVEWIQCLLFADYAAANVSSLEAVLCGFTLTHRASNTSPLVITAHKMRAFLVANAIAAFCHPRRSLRAVTCHETGEVGSLRLCVFMTADVAPWISKPRK